MSVSGPLIGGRNSKFGVWMYLEVAECHVPFLGHCDLNHDDLISRIIMSGPQFLFY